MPSEKLKIIIEDRCIYSVRPYAHKNTPCVIIPEAQDSASLQNLTILDMLENDICFTFDIGNNEDAQYSPCLSTGTQFGHKLQFNKRCDFIIVRKQSGNVYVYFGDLKSKTLRKQKIFRQLYASRLFFDYIVGVLRWEFPTFKDFDDYKPRYVCCHDNTAKKDPRKAIKGTSQIRNNQLPEDAIHFVPVKVNPATKSGVINFAQLSA